MSEQISVEVAVFLPLIYQTELGIVLIPSILAGIADSMLGFRATRMWLEPRLRQKSTLPP